jgi:serine acetyltransferase
VERPANASSQEDLSALGAAVREARLREFRAARPPFLRAVSADIDAYCENRGEARPASKLARLRAALRLCHPADDFLGLFLYRLRTALADAGVPIVPRLLQFASAQFSGIRIGSWVLLGEGAYFPHGQVILDGFTKVGRGATFAPWSGLGLVEGSFTGPTLGENVFVGTGAKILGPVTIGANARIGANAVVLSDVPAGATAIGRPARVVDRDGPAAYH